MRKLGWAFAAVVLHCAAASASEMAVTGGTVRGSDLPDGSTVFLGIPYAQPPVGPLRWKPPEPVRAWTGVRDATKSPAPCLQHDEGWNAADAARSDEDCLYLSIHAPRHAPSERLPVLFWIHGGSNRAGSGAGYTDSAIYTQGVVLVAIEYRLGVFGFLSLRSLTAEALQHASGNFAIMDQIAALTWVKANIARFGGDPDNVTIAGQSAGAFDVGLLLASPLARGLFHKAIMESGGSGLPARSLQDNEAIGAQFAAALHVPTDAGGLAALRSAPARSLLAPGDALTPPNGMDRSTLWGQPVLDGWVLPRDPHDVFAAGEQAPVPIIIGNNSKEFVIDAPAEAMRPAIKALAGDRSEQVIALYGLVPGQTPADDPVLGNFATQFITDIAFRCPANRLAEAQEKAGQKTWRYQFGVAAPDAHGAVAHNAELRYVFDASPASADFGTWPPLQRYWANFARTGDPNGAGLPVWPRMGKDNAYIEFTPGGPRTGNDLRGPYCRLLEPR